jgi:hypothetical protein
MLKKRDVIDDAYEDDIVRTSASQNRVTTTLCTEKFFLRTQYIHTALPAYQWIGVEGGGGQERDGQCNAYKWSQLGFRSQSILHTAEGGLQNLSNYFLTGED